MNRILFAFVAVLAFAGCKPLATPSSKTPPASAQSTEAPASKTQVVLVKIPEELLPIMREARFQIPLEAILNVEGLGKVTGGGTLAPTPDAQGNKGTEWATVDVELSDFEKGMPALKRELIRLGAPEGTTIIEYTRGGKKVEEKL